jgi:U3 small nucleolar RNA-associated protein MPP10
MSTKIKQPDALTQAEALVRSVLDNLENLDSPSEKLKNNSKDALKILYEYSRSVEPSKFAPKNALGELHVDGFSDGQIWQQMVLSIEHLANIAAKKQPEWVKKTTELLSVPIIPAAEESEEDDMDIDEDVFDEDDEDDGDDGDDGESEEEVITTKNNKNQIGKKVESISSTQQQQQQQQQRSQKSSLKKRKHVLDDGFFDHDDYERFANQGDLYGTDGYDGEEIDLFDPKIYQDEEDDERFASYKDFFGDYVPEEFANDDELDFDKDIFANDPFDGEGEEGYEGYEGYEGDVGLFGEGEDGFDSFNTSSGFGEEEEEEDMFDDFDAKFGNEFDEDDDEDNYDEDDEFSSFSNTKKRKNIHLFEDENDDDDSLVIDSNTNRPKNQQNIDEVNSYMKIDDSDAVVDHLKTPYDRRRGQLDNQIDALEREISGPKSWDMKGEASGYQRHKDDLVSHDIDFEHGLKLAAPITADIALQFEEIIKARIRDNAFDDVQPRGTLQGDELFTKLQEKNKEELSTSKPRFGLAEQYERDYKAVAQGFGEENQELQKKYTDISRLFAILGNQLDALCNYHYTAKAKVQELNVTSSASVIHKTEITPGALAQATITQGSLLTDIKNSAPQELHQAKSTGLETSRAEMTKAEKDAAIHRRKAQKKSFKEHQEHNIQQKAKAGDKGAQKKVEQDKFAKEYAKITKSGNVTVHSTAQKGKKTGTSHNYTTMAGVVDAVKQNEQNAANPHKKKKEGINASQTNSRSIMQ